ncbi:cAMP-dependent protein kinase inhibitor gamma isoform X1 [Plectropomus leopardus]|uniref:cAMP-dependent protein kinase inhibitor gamma isoform X1 n=2 Tax=Plectropomus leopardus TaxID=160734 RepID=UPI001C4C4E06|nr:cAMP-dependent protein kinase inhibitor gamma isoform X1 [Plectropomus leopardus]
MSGHSSLLLLVKASIDHSLFAVFGPQGHYHTHKGHSGVHPTPLWCNESAGHGQMMDVETSYSDFINCDRTGRRNAVPDIAGEGEGAASTSELTKDLAEMDLKAAEGDPGASPAPEAEGSTSQDAQGGGGPS